MTVAETDILNRSISQSAKKYAVIAMLIIFCSSAAAAGPIYEFIVYGKHSTFIGAKLPYFEPNSNVEFAILSICQTMLGFYTLTGELGIEMINTLSMDMINAFVQTTNFKKDILTKKLRSGKASVRMIRSTLKGIVQSIEAVNE